MLFAQSPPQTPPAPAQTTHAPKQKPSPAEPAATPAPAAPAAPPAPNWPANDQPAPATVIWDSRGLLIVAYNSSLSQILKQVATETGAKLEGMETDQRVFGTYGPGPARDVITQLLDGSDYNVLLIGDQGQGTPRRIVLSSRAAPGAQPSGNLNQPPSGDEDTEADQEAQPEPPQAQPPPQNPAPGVPMRPPQQIMQERQRQAQQQQTPPN